MLFNAGLKLANRPVNGGLDRLGSLLPLGHSGRIALEPRRGLRVAGRGRELGWLGLWLLCRFRRLLRGVLFLALRRLRIGQVVLIGRFICRHGL
ncbi:MAG: hypothetical protein E5X13_17020 [Mesorhizobium sp.]|nr:MAG: hypothetical protein E5X13_17020 [Mesorhizobium sp.]